MASIPSQPAADSAPSTYTRLEPNLAGKLLVLLAPLAHDAFEQTLANLSQAFAGTIVLIATPDTSLTQTDGGSGQPQSSAYAERFTNLRLLPDPQTTPTLSQAGAWTLTAADFLNAFNLAQQHSAGACLVLGAESQSLSPQALKDLAGALTANADLAVARYDLGPREGLVNSAVLYPMNRAVYGARARFPLAIDLGLSLRMAERLATVAQRFTASGQSDALLWPTAEAAVGAFRITEVPVGARTIPPPNAADLNSLLGRVTASLFTDIEARAAFWQRSRTAPPQTNTKSSSSEVFNDLEVEPMLDSFRLAYSNLQDIWSLVLPPNSLLGLKRLAAADASAFRMADALWARIVYDFLLAYRQRTINRGHLLGALTPLYLAWVASHILSVRGGITPERHIEEQAQAFEFDKPYLVSRWRWPDRFNP